MDRGWVLELPNDIIESSTGLAFDIGGSVAKLIYRSKEEYENGKAKLKTENEKGRLHLAIFTREKVNVILAFIEKNCDISRRENGITEICCTGFGSNKWRKEFEEKLSIKLNNLIEHDCFAKSLQYLTTNLPGNELFLPADNEGMQEAKKLQFAWFQTAMKAMKFTQKGKFDKSGGPPPWIMGGPPKSVAGGPPPGVMGGPPPGVSGGPPPGVSGGPPPGVSGGPPPGVMGGSPQGVAGGPPPGVMGGPPPGVSGGPPPGVTGGPPPGVIGGPPPGVSGGPPPGVMSSSPGIGGPPRDNCHFPCLMCILGSGVTFAKVEEDGSFKIIDGTTIGGRTFLGLGSVLTGGVKDFDELMRMAEQGDPEGVDVYVKDLKSADSDGDAYSIMPDDAMLFHFGKGSTHDICTFKKEDMLASLFRQECSTIAQLAHLVSMTSGIRRVYFVGSWVNSPLAIRHLTHFLTMRGMKDKDKNNQPLNTHFSFIKYGGYLGAIGAYLMSAELNAECTHI